MSNFSYYTVTLTDINDNYEKLVAAGIEVLAISADPSDVSKELESKLGLKFALGCGLTVEQMRTLGLYVSYPTNYIEQTFAFAEPAFFLLNPDNSIRYITISNNPMGGRVNLNYLLMGHSYVQERSKTDAGFATVVWGTA